MTSHLSRRFNPKRRTFAFTLIEMAIVVSVVGAITAVIWAKASDVMLANNVRNLNRQTISIAHAVRSVFAEQSGVRGTPATLMVPLDQQKVFPGEMRDGSTVPDGIIYHHWYQLPISGLGSLQLEAAYCTGVPTADSTTAAPCFNIDLLEMPSTACVQILLSSTQQSGAGGLQALIVNGVGIAIPTDLASASGACAPVTNTMTWVYLLRDNG